MKKGAFIFSEFIVTEEEVKLSRFDIIKHRKSSGSQQLGKFIGESMDLFKEQDKDPRRPEIKKFTARVAIIQLDEYKLAIKNLESKLRDLGLGTNDRVDLTNIFIDLIEE